LRDGIEANRSRRLAARFTKARCGGATLLTTLGILAERLRDQRARELEEAARLPQQPNPLQLPPRLRNMLAKLFGTPDFTTDDVAALEYSAAMFWTIPNFGLKDWKELKTWMERAGKSPVLQRGSDGRHSRDSW